MYMHYWGVDSMWYLNIPFWVPPVLVILGLWSIFWKGLALWHSARRGEPWWFVIMLVVNTMGILEIVYLFAFAKLSFESLFKAPRQHNSHHP